MSSNIEHTILKLVKEGPKKALSSPTYTLLNWIFLIIIYLSIVIYFKGIRDDLNFKITQSLFLIEIFLMLLLALSSALSASMLALPDVNQKAWIRFLPLIPLVIFTTLLAYSTFATSALSMIECILLSRFDCVFYIIFFSIVRASIMFYSIQKAAPIYCCWAGSMAGLSAASFGYILLRIIDPSDDPFQLIIWHFLPVILIMIIGMLLGGFISSKALKLSEID
jgi:hypothetical protein